MVQDCLFCKIFRGETSAKEVYRDEAIVAFEDIRPVAPTHILVVPKEHIPSVHDVTDSQGPTLAHMVEVANRIADERGIDRQGYRLVFNKGPQAGQSVYHLHLHLLGGEPWAGHPASDRPHFGNVGRNLVKLLRLRCHGDMAERPQAKQPL